MTFCRSILLLTLFLISSTAFTQEITRYFTVDGKPAQADKAQRTRKGVMQNNKWRVLEYETSLTRLISESFYLDSNFLVRDGDYTEYWDFAGKSIHYRWQYVNGQKTGLCVSFYNSGKPNDTCVYAANGHLIKYRSYYESGRLEDSALLDVSGKGVSKGFWEDGRPEHSGSFTNWQKTGPWSYYTEVGALCAIETMRADTLASALDYNETGKPPVVRKENFPSEADFPGGENHWLYYINKKISEAKLPDAFLKDEIQGVVIVSFMIDTEGNVTDIKVVQSLHPDMDKLAVAIIQSSSGKWIPARGHNRIKKSYKKQPFVFRLTNEVGNR
jgi:TonB family protein